MTTRSRIRSGTGTGWPDGYASIILDDTDSTNAEASRRAAELSGPTWILALSQTAARGRRGRAWSMPKGNFAATLVMRPTEPPDQVALRSFVISLALFDAFVAVTARPQSFALKWPNDVLLNGGKVAGILLESIGAGSGQAQGQNQSVAHLAIGVGVNLALAPGVEDVEKGAVPPVALVGETGALVSPADFLAELASAYARWEVQFTTYGFAPIREAWLARATRLGEIITARTMTDSVTGRFETVDMSGALVLTTQQARHAIPAADIFFQAR